MPARSTTLDPTLWLDQHADYLYRYAMFRLRDASVAEDLIQDTLLAALQSLDTYEGRSSERTWLMGILKHKIIDHFRKLARSREVSGGHDEIARDEYEPFEKTGRWAGHWHENQAPTDWNVDAATLLEKKDFWRVFDRCLASLPPRTAAAFALREIEGLSSDEICEVLNISPNNLWVMLHRARMQLRRSIEMQWFRGQSGDSVQPASPTREEHHDEALLRQANFSGLVVTNRAV